MTSHFRAFGCVTLRAESIIHVSNEECSLLLMSDGTCMLLLLLWHVTSVCINGILEDEGVSFSQQCC